MTVVQWFPSTGDLTGEPSASVRKGEIGLAMNAAYDIQQDE
jgi:hypothetical protein